MSISKIQAGHPPYFVKNSNHTVKSSLNHSAKTDIVHISDQAKGLSQENQNRADRVEVLGLPDWLVNLVPAGAVMDGEAMDREIAQFGKPGSNPWALSNQKSVFSGEIDKALGEYLDKLLSYFQQELKDSGIENSEDYHESILQDKAVSETVHQDVKKHLASDVRAMELMQLLGISL